MDQHITTPITEEVTKKLHSGDYVYITGTIYVARDAAHKRMIEALDRGEQLPIDIKDATIYYMGPSPAREGRPIGSAGPTTATRMDKYAPTLLDLGEKAMIGKGKRSKEVIDAIIRNHAVYFAAVGGAATALTVQCALDGAASIAIFNPDDPFLERAKGTAEKLAKEVPDCKVSVYCLDDQDKLREEIANADILANGTLAGMKPHDDLTLVDKSMFHKDLVVADCVYNPAETRMVKEAKEAGVKLAVGGKGMLLWQGAESYKLYTGLEMPTDEYQKFQAENEGK